MVVSSANAKFQRASISSGPIYQNESQTLVSQCEFFIVVLHFVLPFISTTVLPADPEAVVEAEVVELWSRQIKPNQALCVHEGAVLVLLGPDVMDKLGVCVTGLVTVELEGSLSRQPKKKAGVWQCLDVVDDLKAAELEVLSWQPPKNPGLWQDVETGNVADAAVEVRLADGAGEAVAEDVVVGSLHPNQPGVLQVDVVDVLDEDELVVVVLVVVSSRQPHQPGVSQVVVRVLVEVEELEEVVVLSDPLLSKYFQLKQSTHSLSGVHFGTSSYFLRT